MNNNLVISDDIWFHVADFIEPEAVKNFALLCKKTNSLVKTKRFWKNLYERHCRKGQVTWIKGLPLQYQFEDINKLGVKALRRFVIESLFYCYPGLTQKIQTGYKLDDLNNRIYVSSWYVKCSCTWIMLTKFTNEAYTFANPLQQLKTSKEENSEDSDNVVNDWENLFNNDSDNDEPLSLACANEGDFLLTIISDRYLPFPSTMDLNSKTLRLTGSREMLNNDMRSKTLILEFTSEGGSTCSFRYENINKYKILPWWHPAFHIFTK